MRTLLLRWLINAIALFVAVSVVPGMHFDGGVGALAGLAAIFGIVNALLRPLLTLLTCPLIVLTFGLFTLVVNALLLFATEWVAVRWGIAFTIDGFWPALIGGLLIGLVSVVAALALREDKGRERGEGGRP